MGTVVERLSPVLFRWQWVCPEGFVAGQSGPPSGFTRAEELAMCEQAKKDARRARAQGAGPSEGSRLGGFGIAVGEEETVPVAMKATQKQAAKAAKRAPSKSSRIEPTFLRSILPGVGGGGPPGGGSGAGGGGLGGIGTAGCNFLPPGNLRDLCKSSSNFLFGGDGNGAGGGSGGCPEGTIKVGNRCIAPGDAFPGGDPLVTGAGGQATQGSFGMPAVTPTVEQRTHRSCPDGMVLGKDDLCYPRQILPRRSKFRKWKQPPRPKISASDWKAIRKAERLKDKLKDLTSAHPGLKTAKNR